MPEITRTHYTRLPSDGPEPLQQDAVPHTPRRGSQQDHPIYKKPSVFRRLLSTLLGTEKSKQAVTAQPLPTSAYTAKMKEEMDLKLATLISLSDTGKGRPASQEQLAQMKLIHAELEDMQNSYIDKAQEAARTGFVKAPSGVLRKKIQPTTDGREPPRQNLQIPHAYHAPHTAAHSRNLQYLARLAADHVERAHEAIVSATRSKDKELSTPRFIMKRPEGERRVFNEHLAAFNGGWQSHAVTGRLEPQQASNMLEAAQGLKSHAELMEQASIHTEYDDIAGVRSFLQELKKKVTDVLASQTLSFYEEAHVYLSRKMTDPVANSSVFDAISAEQKTETVFHAKTLEEFNAMFRERLKREGELSEYSREYMEKLEKGLELSDNRIKAALNFQSR